MLGMFRGTDIMLLWDGATDSLLEGLAFKQITEKCTGLEKKKKSKIILGNKLLISPGEEMATHSRILAWEIPWTEEPAGVQSKRLPRLRHN